MDTLSDNIPFGYTLSQKLSVDTIDVGKIRIKSPVIRDELSNTIKKYTVMYSTYPLSQILQTPSLIDQAKEKTFEFVTVTGEITMELSALVDGINSNLVYYLSVIPKDNNGILWEISNEIRFKLSTQQYGEWVFTGWSHLAPGANMSLSNITHSVANNRASLRWTAVPWSDKVDIFLFNPVSGTFERLAIVNMSDENYSFALTRNGEHLLNFIPNNAWTEYRYSFIAEWITATAWSSATTPWSSTAPTIWVIPATWPKENILIALSIAVVLYLVYRRLRAKH